MDQADQLRDGTGARGARTSRQNLRRQCGAGESESYGCPSMFNLRVAMSMAEPVAPAESHVAEGDRAAYPAGNSYGQNERMATQAMAKTEQRRWGAAFFLFARRREHGACRVVRVALPCRIGQPHSDGVGAGRRVQSRYATVGADFWRAAQSGGWTELIAGRTGRG